MLKDKYILRTQLESYVRDGKIRAQYHDRLPLAILNYTQDTQYSGSWDGLTLASRGLVVDTSSEDNELVIVARPFEKFFNLSEIGPETIPVNEPSVFFEKMDGSLGILFNYEGEWVWATRGSFQSDQAMWAKKFFEANYSYDTLDPDYTHLFEIIYSDNRIVVSYKEDKLVSLGSIHTETGIEVVPNPIFPVPQKFDISIEEAQSYERENFEGFVWKFKSGFRVKIKLEEYVKIHRMIFGLSSYSIWENLQQGTYYKMLAEIPEEFLGWTQRTAAIIMETFHKEMALAYSDFRRWTEDSRKETALSYKTYAKEPMAARFALLDGKDPSDIIWKHIKPEYEQAK